MTAGLGSDITSFNRLIGQAVLDLANALAACTEINNLLNDANRGYNTAGLMALGYSSDDVTNIQAAFNALSGLQQVALGLEAQPGAEPTNFFFQAQLLMGTNPMPAA